MSHYATSFEILDTSTTSSVAKRQIESKNAQLLRQLIEKKNKKLKKKVYSNAEEQEIDLIIQKSFDSIIGKTPYSPFKMSDWMSKMIQTISDNLVKLNGSKKFLVHCTISAKTDNLAICTANMCSWDTTKDTAYYSEWMSKTIFGAVQVFFITHRFSK